jgi:uncharacterized membrane protein
MEYVFTEKFLNGVLVILANVGTNYLLQDIFPVANKLFKSFFMKKVVLFILFYMATRDVIVSVLLTICFSLMIDHFLNEKSRFCLIPERFKDFEHFDTDSYNSYLSNLRNARIM